MPKAENVPKLDMVPPDYIRDHIIIGRPEAAMRDIDHRNNGKVMRL